MIILLTFAMHVEHLGWIAKALTGAIVNSPSSLSIEPRIYITSQKAQLPDITTLEYDTAEPSSPTSSSVEEKKVDPIPIAAFKTKRGRPNVHRIIQDAVAISPGPVSVDGESESRFQIIPVYLLLYFFQLLGRHPWPRLFVPRWLLK